MNKLFWTTIMMGILCHVAIAQKASDSSISGHPMPSGNSVLFDHFSCSSNNFNKVSLEWTSGSASGTDYFIVEHGKDSTDFETLGILKRSSGSSQFEFIDSNPSSGMNYYRIKSTDTAGIVSYSLVLNVYVIGPSSFKFYPNPVDKLLIIDTQKPGDIQILGPMGNQVFTQRIQAGVQVVNVSSLEKGQYIIRMIYKEGNQVVLDHLLKN